MKILITNPNVPIPDSEMLAKYLSTWYANYIKYTEEEYRTATNPNADGVKFTIIETGERYYVLEVDDTEIGGTSTTSETFGNICFLAPYDYTEDELDELVLSYSEFEKEAGLFGAGNPINFDCDESDKVKSVLYGYEGNEQQFKTMLRYLAPTSRLLITTH